MTGPEHYHAAELLLNDLRRNGMPADKERIENLLAKAQVHATLALAATFGLSASLPLADQDAWQQAAASAFMR